MPFIYKLKSTEVNTTSTWLFKYSSSSSFAASKSCACVRKVRAMALEAVVYPQPQDPFGYGIKDHNLLADVELSNWGYEDFNLNLENEEQQGGSISICSFLENQTENYPCVDWSPQSMEVELPHKNEQNMSNPSSDASNCNTHNLDSSTSTPSPPKRRRARSRKNKEEIENQRMTHIAVERNRRKQMNEYLSVLRSIMPESYVPRGDQASIIGGAINFVKELEQKLQFLGVQKEKEGKSDVMAIANANSNKPFSEFFTFPQYSTSGGSGCETSTGKGEQLSAVQSGIADIEVIMVESHANLKIRSKKFPKQLLKMVSSLHGMRLTILHLNVTTTGEIVLYSISVKVEDDCKLGSVDEIAAAIYQMLDRIQQESNLN
ncbi:transcription factor bHLH94-like [Lotus japonicus]|uniref:transcription factor bHLH94-like n=1 Tax=Lotus japonicus TaxID=34305 RepID=UPI00258412BF|nr:transcription factor bHLH94-like [Lotus japonicus]